MYDEDSKNKYGSYQVFVKHEDFKPLTMHYTTFQKHFINYKKDADNFQLVSKKEEAPRKQRSNIKNLDEILIPEMIKLIKELVKKGVDWKKGKKFQEIALDLKEKCGLPGKFKACNNWCINTRKKIIEELQKYEQDDENNKNDDGNNLMEKEGVTANKKNKNQNTSQQSPSYCGINFQQ